MLHSLAEPLPLVASRVESVAQHPKPEHLQHESTMLQIISGRFFKEGSERHRTPGKGILYSNYSWVAPLATPVGTLDPVDRSGAVPAYVFSFDCLIEKESDTPRAGELIATGEDEIVRQFQLLAMFGLRAYFTSDRAAVLANCRQRAISSHERYVPSRFVDRILSDQLRATVDEVAAFKQLLEKILRLPRSKYVALLDVLETVDHALNALNGSLDLAYSMLVYCLEALAQKFDQYQPVWADYDQSVRSKLDDVLEAVPDTRDAVRAALLESAHLKLGERYRHFVEEHLGDDFFIERARGHRDAVRRSQLSRALKNAYRLRSEYVHKLQSIREQLHHPTIAEGEVFTWDGEPYLTFRGLFNVSMHVLKSFVARGESLDAEQIPWRSQLPGIMQFRVAPQYWIWQHEHLAKLSQDDRAADVRARFEGFLQLFVAYATTGEKIADIGNVIAVYEALIPQSTKRERNAMVATYVLFNAVAGPKASPNFERVLGTLDKELGLRTIPNLAIEILLHDRILHGAYEELIKVYDTYAEKRYAPTTVELPPLLELKLLAILANMSLANGDEAEYRRLLDIAIGEAAGNASLQDMLITAKAARASIDHRAILTLKKNITGEERSAGEPQAADATSGAAAGSSETTEPSAPEDKNVTADKVPSEPANS